MGVIMSFHNMRIGVVAHYPPPSGIDGWDKQAWLIGNAADLGLGVQQISVTEFDRDRLLSLRQLAESKNVELESIGAGFWDLTGDRAPDAREKLLASIRIADALGCDILRGNHGRGTVALSRFSKEWPCDEHMQFCVDNLREAGRIAADHGMKIAIESNCDFTGREWSEIFSLVDLPNVGAMLDTANGITVFTDPNEDVEHLARHAINMHVKDVALVEAGEPNRVPLRPVGCALGEGIVDIERALALVGEQSPNADGMHVVIEIAWVEVPTDTDRSERLRDLFGSSIEYLRDLVGKQLESDVREMQ